MGNDPLGPSLSDEATRELVKPALEFDCRPLRPRGKRGGRREIGVPAPGAEGEERIVQK